MPTLKYPYVIQIQYNKKGKWNSITRVRADQTLEYALSAMDDHREAFPMHNHRMLRLDIYE